MFINSMKELKIQKIFKNKKKIINIKYGKKNNILYLFLIQLKQ
jgi:hypothetical protein